MLLSPQASLIPVLNIDSLTKYALYSRELLYIHFIRDDSGLDTGPNWYQVMYPLTPKGHTCIHHLSLEEEQRMEELI